MDPLFKSLIIQLVPQPRQMPLPPFDHEALQGIFSEVIRKYPYQAFGFTPNGRGAVFQNGPEDAVELRPAQLQIQANLDGQEPLVATTAEEKVVTILRVACARLELNAFLQCGVQIIAKAPVPGAEPKAKDFVADHLMKGGDQADILGSGYFAGGVRFRRIEEDGTGEDSLTIEPYIHDDTLVYLDYQKVRVAVERPIELDHLSSWISDGFEFLSGSTMNLLTR
jgi:hypothetical protein